VGPRAGLDVWRTENRPFLTRIRSPDIPVRSPVAIVTHLDNRVKRLKKITDSFFSAKQTFFDKYSNTKFHENPSSCCMRTDGQT